MCCETLKHSISYRRGQVHMAWQWMKGIRSDLVFTCSCVFSSSQEDEISFSYRKQIKKNTPPSLPAPFINSFPPGPLHLPPPLSSTLHPLSSSRYLPHSHRYSLEGWAASSIYFPLGCRWFCSPLAIHNQDHKKRSQSRQAPDLPRCECHSWEYQDLCRLWPVNLKGKHTNTHTH